MENAPTVRVKTIGLIGARGHTGRVLLRLIAGHPGLQLAFASSRALAGEPVSSLAPEITGALAFEALDPEAAAQRGADLVIMALPDGAGAPFVAAFETHRPETVLIDLSSDHRFNQDWVYGLPELLRLKGQGERPCRATRIANPGCYATMMQLVLAPLTDYLGGVPSVFGVSGYSGAGTTPSPRNDSARLGDNLMAYALAGHTHEREATRHLGHPLRFTPHVHPAFSGLCVTVHAPFQTPMDRETLKALYHSAYDDEPLVVLGDGAPELKQGAGFNGIRIGGFETGADGLHGVIVGAGDNLLKGAAIQALQNINLALGFEEFTGIAQDRTDRAK